MKIRVILLLIAVTVSLTACANADISYKLSDDNSLSINYFLTFSPEGKDISGNISLIKEYWTQMGFTAEDSEKSGVFTVNGEKTVNCTSRESAAKGFSSILTDKNSLFYDVKFIYTPSYFEDTYDLSATISLKDIIRKSEGSNIPSTEIESFLSGAENSSYKLSITLPGEILETNADEQDEQACIWLLKYGETRQLKIASKRVFEENVSHYASLNEAQSRDSLLFIVGCSAAGLLLLITVIIAAVRRAARPTKSEINGERF